MAEKLFLALAHWKMSFSECCDLHEGTILPFAVASTEPFLCELTTVTGQGVLHVLVQKGLKSSLVSD